MNRATTMIRTIALVAAFLGLAVGCSTGDSEQADTPATTTAAMATTPDAVKTAVFERAYSECASTEFERLAAKYKVADTTRPGVATAVALGWIETFDAGQDAVEDGRSGCLQGFEDR